MPLGANPGRKLTKQREVSGTTEIILGDELKRKKRAQEKKEGQGTGSKRHKPTKPAVEVLKAFGGGTDGVRGTPRRPS